MFVARTKKLARALRRAQTACIVAGHHDQRSVTLPLGVLKTIVETFDADYLDDPVRHAVRAPSEQRRSAEEG